MKDKRRQEIIADYVESGSYRETARKFGVSPNTVKNYVQGDVQIAQKFAHKKEENTKTMLAYFDSKRETAQDLIDEILKTSKSQIADAPLRDKMGALKILKETFGNERESRAESRSALEQICETLERVTGNGS